MVLSIKIDISFRRQVCSAQMPEFKLQYNKIHVLTLAVVDPKSSN